MQLLKKLEVKAESLIETAQEVRFEGGIEDSEVISFEYKYLEFSLYPEYSCIVTKQGVFIGHLYWNPNMDGWGFDYDASFTNTEIGGQGNFTPEEEAVVEYLCSTYEFSKMFVPSDESGMDTHYELFYALSNGEATVCYLLYPGYKCDIIHPSGFVTAGTWDPDELNSFL